MESDSLSLLTIACAGFFMVCTAIFFYYLYVAIKSYMKCKSEKKDDIPCPNTCEPGYECKQSETVAEFVIGDVVQEGVAEDDKQEVEAAVEPEPELPPAPEPELPPAPDASI